MHGYNDLSRAKTLLSTRSRPLKIYCQHSTFYISPTTTETFILWSHFISDMNVEKTKVMRISRQSFSVKIMIDQKQLENVESFKYLSSILTNDGRCTCEIKCRIAMAEAAFIKKRTLFTSTLDLELRKKLVKCYIWSIALYSAETWTLRAVDQKHLESFEIWCWRRTEKISWTDHVRN